MKIDVYNQQGKKAGTMILLKEIFDIPFNADLVHQAVVAQMANSRVIHAKTKTRAEVRGGGRKPWRQKGTGRARHGSIRSPIWSGGGITFGPTTERNYGKKINKKMKRKALFMILSAKVRDNEVILLDDLNIMDGKTKEMADLFRNLESKIASLEPKTTKEKTKNKKQKNKKNKKTPNMLVVIPEKNENIVRANRNIPYTKTVRADSLNMLDILSYKYLLLTKNSIDVIKQTFANDITNQKVGALKKK